MYISLWNVLLGDLDVFFVIHALCSSQYTSLIDRFSSISSAMYD